VAKLTARGHPPEQVEAVAAELEGQGLLSDARYAEALFRVRVERGYGPLRIAVEMRDKGLDEALIRRWVDFSDPAWVERLEALRRRRFGDARPSDDAGRARQMRFLQSRGFTREQIERVMRPDPWD